MRFTDLLVMDVPLWLVSSFTADATTSDSGIVDCLIDLKADTEAYILFSGKG